MMRVRAFCAREFVRVTRGKNFHFIQNTKSNLHIRNALLIVKCLPRKRSTCAVLPPSNPQILDTLSKSPRSVNTGIKKTDLKDGKFVFESDTKGRILIQEFMGELYAINNKCPHLGLPLQGKTPLLSATCTKNGGVVCSVHGSGTFAFHIFKTSFHLDQNNRVRFKNRCRVRRVVS